MSNIDKHAELRRELSNPAIGSNHHMRKLALALLDELEAAEKRVAELEALARGVKQFSEFQICHYGATEDYAKGYIDCQNNYNKVLFAAAGKGDAS